MGTARLWLLLAHHLAIALCAGSSREPSGLDALTRPLLLPGSQQPQAFFNSSALGQGELPWASLGLHIACADLA